MFFTSTFAKDGFEIVLLKDESSGTTVEVIPACGAILHGFAVLQNGKAINVIDSYASKEEFAEEFEALGFKSAKLSPFVCRLRNGEYKYGEKQYHVNKFYLGENAIHGLIYDEPFKVINQGASDSKAFIEMMHEYRGKDPGYPFSFDCKVRYELSYGNQLSVQTTVINRDEGIIPICDGWHPYFTFGKTINDCQLEFQSKEMVVFDDEFLPTGKLNAYQDFGSLRKIDKTFFDNCFTVNFAECQPMLVFREPEIGLQLEISPAPSYPYLQVYTPPHRNSIAFENLSAAPDAFNNGMGLISLLQGEEKVFETRYRLRLV